MQSVIAMLGVGIHQTRDPNSLILICRFPNLFKSTCVHMKALLVNIEKIRGA